MPDSLAYSGRRVLVTGASGFIGRRLCRRLRELGAEVEPASRQPAPPPGEEGRWHQVDLASPADSRRLVAETRPETAFHLSSQVTESRERTAVLPTFHANLASTVYLLDALAEQGCGRIVQIASFEEPEPGDPVSTPSSPYAAAKWSAGAYARMFHQLWSTPVVLARLFMVYGPEQRDLTKLVPRVITSALLGREPELSSGKRPVDWIYVDDVVEGLLRAGVAEGVIGLQTDLGSGKLVPVRSVVEQIYRLLALDREPPFGNVPDRALEPVRVARVEETGELLGWSPQVALEDGLARTVDWYRREIEAGRLMP